MGKNYDIKRTTKECYNTNVSVYVNGKVGLKTFKMITTDLIDYMKENTGKNIVSADIYFINSSDFSMNLPEEFNNGLSRDVIKNIFLIIGTMMARKKFLEMRMSDMKLSDSQLMLLEQITYIYFFIITIIF